MGIRSQIQNRNRFVSELKGRGEKRFAWVLLISLLAHILFFVGIFWIHDFNFLTPKPRVVRVDLVSFVPGPVGGQSEPEPAPAQTPNDATVNLNTKPVPPAVEAQPAPVPVLKPDVSLKTKPKNIKDLMAARKEKPVEKKKTEKLKPKSKKDSEKELQKAREALAKKVENQNQEQINQALQRMQAAIAATEKENAQGVGQGSGPGTGVGKQGASPLVLYQMVIASAIRQNWVFNEVMAGINQNLEVRILVKILKSGEIRDISYETRSGNQYLDESAKKAIRRSGPLPPLPKGMPPSYDMILGFTPRGLN